MMQQPKYRFYPTLLDSFLNYKDSDSIWDKYYGVSENPSVSAEEFHDQKRKDLLDSINRIEHEPSEAAAKGTCLNEIVDRIINKQTQTDSKVKVKTIRKREDLLDIFKLDGTKDAECIELRKEYFERIDLPAIYASVDGFEFFFDVVFCQEIANYYKGCLCQYRTNAILPTSYGGVELYGYIDYLREKTIFDLKTTKNYSFGNYAKYNQRHAYPYCMEESGMMSEVRDFEFTVYQLSGGTMRNPIITGKQNREVYTYSRNQSIEVLTQNCERLIDFVQDNIEEIDFSRTKIFKEN